MRIVLIFILITLVFIWTVGFFLVNDFSVPSKNLRTIDKVLVIFPHADDELLSTGGLMHQLSVQNKKVTWLVLTKGEKGSENAILDLRLKDIRTQEAQKVAQILGVSRLIQEDLGDGELVNNKDEIKSTVTKVIETEKPQLIITYDLAGFYGHPDHIAVSEIVTALVNYTYKKSMKLWYVSQPESVQIVTKLPEHMAKDQSFRKKRTKPTIKVFVGGDFITKMKGLYTYKSQYFSFAKSIPGGDIIPLWISLSTQLYEYFYEVR